MANVEYQATINWDDMALVRPISAPVTPSTASGTGIELTSNPAFPATINWDDLALVRPISASSSPLFTAGVSVALEAAGVQFGTKLVLVEGQGFVINRGGVLEGGTIVEGSIAADSTPLKDLLIKLGEARDLKIFAIDKSGAIGPDIGIASVSDLPSGPYQIIGIQGGLDTSEGFGTILLSSPDGEWEAIVIQNGTLAGGGASMFAAEGAPGALVGYGDYLTGVESAIVPVGFNSLELAQL